MSHAITTTAKQAQATILAALSANTLAAPNGVVAAYADEASDGHMCYCAIGSLYPPEVALLIERTAFPRENPEVITELPELFRSGVSETRGSDYPLAAQLITKGLLNVPAHEFEWFRALQQLHDRWSSNVNCAQVGDPSADLSSEQRFMEHLNTLPALPAPPPV